MFFQVKRAAGDDYTERNAPFIFRCVKKIFGDLESYDGRTLEQINKTPNQEKRLYNFFLGDGKTKYPVYIGITNRNFRQRFKEHHDDGSIHKCNKGEFPTITPPIRITLKVICIPLSYGMQAKLMESVSLSTFDFCLNTEEIGSVRKSINTNDQFSIGASKPGFDSSFGNVMREIASVYEEYKKD